MGSAVVVEVISFVILVVQELDQLGIGRARLGHGLESRVDRLYLTRIGELAPKLNDGHVEDGSIKSVESAVAVEQKGKGRLEPLVLGGADQ